jgi:hypothetical protein
MATDRQIAANRRNGALSPGPKTAAGKARSSRNALKHGLAIPITRDHATARKIRRAARQVLLVLYNGNAGWSKMSGGVGICHAELKHGLDTAPGKVRLIRIGSDVDVRAPSGKANDQFREFVDRQALFRGSATSIDELMELSEQTILHALADLVGLGVREARRGNFYSGDALEWSKLDYRERQMRIKEVLLEALVTAGAKRLNDHQLIHTVNDSHLFLVVDAVPAALSIGAARELVGRPFLRDYEHLEMMGEGIGPVHIIGCNRGATESQALQMLGFPDATVVTAPFGIYVADDVQKVQFVLLANCRDQTGTRTALQRFLEWQDASGEADDLVKRARSRKRIVKAIAAERLPERINAVRHRPGRGRRVLE